MTGILFLLIIQLKAIVEHNDGELNSLCQWMSAPPDEVQDDKNESHANNHADHNTSHAATRTTRTYIY